MVEHGGNFVVWADCQELGCELLAFVDIDPMLLVVEPGFLEHDVDFLPVGRVAGIKVDHHMSFTIGRCHE